MAASKAFKLFEEANWERLESRPGLVRVLKDSFAIIEDAFLRYGWDTASVVAPLS